MSKHDWSAIETEYVTTQQSLRDLAAQHNVSLRQLGGEASERDWQRKREEHSNKIATERENKVADELSSELAAQDLDAVRELVRVAQLAIKRWESDGHKAGFRDILEALKVIGANQGAVTARTAMSVADEPDDRAVMERIRNVFDGARARRDQQAASDFGDEAGAGWTD